VLIVGGYNSQPVASAEIYDPTTKTFTFTGSMAVPRTYHSATLLADGRVMISGGVSAFTNCVPAQSSVEVYDPATGKFSGLGNMLAARTDQGTALLPSGKVLIAGGSNGCTVALGSAEIFDPTSKTSTAISNLKVPRNGRLSMVALANGKYLFAGGYSGTSGINSAEVFDPNSNTFTVVVMQYARAGLSVTPLSSGKILIAGGHINFNPYNTVELFDPSSGAGSFAGTGSMAEERLEQGATRLADGRVFVAGGRRQPGAVVAIQSAEIYDPNTGQWTSAGQMSTPRIGPTATTLHNGHVLIVGGYTYGGPGIGSAELFVPQ
jgi:hypothetical protein